MRIQVEISPEPDNDERSAIVAALARLLEADEQARRSAWRTQALREAVEGEDDSG